MSTYTLPGGEVETKSVSLTFLSLSLMEALPRPKPPIVMVDYGDGKKVPEVNAADPDYTERTLPEYDAMLEMKRVNLILKRGVVKRPLSEAEQLAVDEVRQDYREEGIEFADSDWLIWIKHVACQGDNDLFGLVRHISQESSPVEGAGEIADGFRGDV